MKRLIRVVCLLLVMATLAAVPAAAQTPTPRASNYLAGYRAYCTLDSSTSLTVSFFVLGAGKMDEIGVSLVKVQYSSDQVNWTTARTFRKAVDANMVDYDKAAHGGMLTCTVPSGQYYRAYVEFYAAKDNGFGERYYYTEII